MTTPLDERDETIRAARIAAREAREGPRVGDFVVMPGGEVRRFTHDWGGGGLQTTSRYARGSFYLTESGHMSYSGGLEPPIPLEQIVPVCVDGDPVSDSPGRCWFFHHDYATAHNGIDTTVPCRLFRLEES